MILIKRKKKFLPFLLQARTSIEEIMSETKIRYCANQLCRIPFSKPDGCNKMKCSCGHATCYVCRKDITVEGYQHFCNKMSCNHRRCGRCGVYTREEDDDEHVKSEGMKRKREFGKVLQKEIQLPMEKKRKEKIKIKVKN
jgi:hypothetical protein